MCFRLVSVQSPAVHNEPECQRLRISQSIKCEKCLQSACNLGPQQKNSWSPVAARSHQSHLTSPARFRRTPSPSIFPSPKILLPSAPRSNPPSSRSCTTSHDSVGAGLAPPGFFLTAGSHAPRSSPEKPPHSPSSAHECRSNDLPRPPQDPLPSQSPQSQVAPTPAKPRFFSSQKPAPAAESSHISLPQSSRRAPYLFPARKNGPTPPQS